MTRDTYIVGGIEFKRKLDLEAHVKAILHGSTFGRLASDDEAFIADLLTNHPSAEVKIGPGVKSIRIGSNGFNGRGFFVERIDGTETDFSYKQCIHPFTYASKVKFAFRRAIDEQTIAVKALAFPNRMMTIPCPITGELITWNDAHVDHEPPLTFASLLQQYLEERNWECDDIPLVEPRGGVGKILPDDIALDWAWWHQQRARLRVISAYANTRLVR
jgi:hypothetical protein